MNVVTRYTFLAFELNHFIDEGKKLDIDETRKHTEDGTLFSWLKEQLEDIDLSLYQEQDKQEMNELFSNLTNAVDSSRKFGVDRDGLCLLVAYCVEGLQQLRHNEGAYN